MVEREQHCAFVERKGQKRLDLKDSLAKVQSSLEDHLFLLHCFSDVLWYEVNSALQNYFQPLSMQCSNVLYVSLYNIIES